MLANLQNHAHTLDDPLRFNTLPNEFPRPLDFFQLQPLPDLPPAFQISLLPEPRIQLRSLHQQTAPAQETTPARTTNAASAAAAATVNLPSTTTSDQPIPAHTALTQILDLVTSQTTSPLFEWNQPSLRFQWRPPPAKKQRRNQPAPPPPEAAPIQIRGLSPATTLSTSRPFLKTATLIRRTSAVLDALVVNSGSAGSSGELPREAHALIYALRHVLDWLRRELIEWHDRHTSQQHHAFDASSALEKGESNSNIIDSNTRALLIISEAAHGLQTCELILDAISELLNCPFVKQPPFRPLPGLNLLPTPDRPTKNLDLSSNPGALLSHIYAHASASFTTSPSLLVRGTMAWILEHTTRAWRQDLSLWIGWPLPAHVGAAAGLRLPIALDLEGGRGKAVREPWCGAQVEQEKDERGELDTGYVLRPARIPSFLSLSTARQLLEAGRALHLLHTATDGQHPLFHLQQRSRPDSNSTSIRPFPSKRNIPTATPAAAILPVPTWTFGADAKAARMHALDGVLLATTNAGARWVYQGKRKRVADAGGTMSSRPSGTHLQGLSSWMEGLSHGGGGGGGGGGGRSHAVSIVERPRHSSLRLFPSRSIEVLPPLPVDAPMKVQEAKRRDQVERVDPDENGDGDDGNDAELRLEKAIRLFDALPGLHLGHEAQGDGRVMKVNEGTISLVDYLAAFCKAAANEVEEEDQCPSFVSEVQASKPTEQGADIYRINTATSASFDLDAATRQTLLQPLLAWSRTINASLVSVFFRDLAVDLYLATCQRFLLLGSEAFRTRLVGVLFDDASEGRGGVDEDRFRARGKSGRVRQAGGIGLSVRLTSSSSWPPSGSELSVSLNLAVAETLAESKASHARVMASSRPLLSLSSLHAAEAALHDLDQRLSFSVIEMQAEKPRSIHALDWLTLTFTPPPLISPLLQAHASACYQRLFNFLLRILRVQTVLRGLAKSTLLLSRSGNTTSSRKSSKLHPPPPPASSTSVASLLFTHDPLLSAALHSFRFEAQHVVNALATYVADVAIGLPWTRFQKRLRQLARGAGAGAGAAPRGTTARGTGSMAGKGVLPSEVGDLDDDDGSSVWTGAGEDDEVDDEDGEEEEEEEEEEEGGERNEETFQLFNVFSLSRYHERVLDRMLQACFLKQRFRGIMKIINDLFQLILDLGQLIQDVESPNEANDKANPEPAEASAYPIRERFYTLQARWKSRYGLLAQSLRLVHLHSRSTHAHQSGVGEGARTDFEQALAAATDLDTSSAVPATGSTGERGQPNVADVEMRRLEAEEELDLRALEDVEGRREQVSTAGVLLNLLALPSL
ncbi:hypothetical protein A4X09_0g1716 [Tilletia walkeri]|uniref:Gamma tubulin complex component C-terminal domain-containing protein n=1 Tax=Tilletia walkeri TaxID=117179 RepID=A0A8X7NBA4_9BASI|nr:hypothetical protein A4X09_0g1716 [Tilletia walkeri]